MKTLLIVLLVVVLVGCKTVSTYEFERTEPNGPTTTVKIKLYDKGLDEPYFDYSRMSATEFEMHLGAGINRYPNAEMLEGLLSNDMLMQWLLKTKE
jgi:hypothetical protein